jgi:uracil-DNA glycosylase
MAEKKKHASLLAPYMNQIFKNVKPSWKKILFSPKIKPILDKCFKAMDLDLINKGVTLERINENGLHSYIRPAPEDILAAFTLFDTYNLRGIILGKDPYPNKRDANGLCFSSKNQKTPPSLSKIIENLHEHKLLKTVTETTNDLTGWAKQGILMLNYYLTRTPNIVKNTTSTADGVIVQCSIEGDGGNNKACLHQFWGEFTDALLGFLSKSYYPEIIRSQRRNIYVMLWGDDAQKVQKHIVTGTGHYGFKVLTWGHPSPLNSNNQDSNNPKNFIHCDHFIRISSEYNMINWDLTFQTHENLCDRFWSYRMINPIGGVISSRSARNELNQLLEGPTSFIYDDGTDTAENQVIRKYISDHKIAAAVSAKTVKVVATDTSKSDWNSDEEQQQQSEPPAPPTPEPVPTPNTRKPLAIYIDGGCKNNGKVDAVGAVGVYFSPLYNGEKTLIGEHKISESLSSYTQKYDSNLKKRVDQPAFTKHTNQRAELTAVLCALEKILDLKDDIHKISKVYMITDSMSYVVSWTGKGRLWKEYESDQTFKNIPNRDLVTLLCRYVWMWARVLKPNCTFAESKAILIDSEYWNVIWVESHQNENKTAFEKLGGLDLEHALGNIEADKLAAPK